MILSPHNKLLGLQVLKCG